MWLLTYQGSVVVKTRLSKPNLIKISIEYRPQDKTSTEYMKEKSQQNRTDDQSLSFFQVSTWMEQNFFFPMKLLSNNFMKQFASFPAVLNTFQ